ncbi:MAG: biotin/lipoyl-containing protein, partial [Actinoallomurus sp.]
MSDILMPRLSDTMEEGVVSSWHKKPGDKVSAGDALVDIETDKALMEYEAYEDGVLGEILVGEGDTAAIGTPIAILVTDGAVPPPRPAPENGATATTGTPGTPATANEADPAATKGAEPPTPAPAAGTAASARTRPPSSPLAR